MRALRIMTWNLRLFSASAAAWEGLSYTAKEDAKQIADAVSSLAVDDPPDVIAFNEVWSDEAAEILKDELDFLYPHTITSFGSAGPTGLQFPPFKLDNSGLMVLSRFPFVQRPNGDNFEFRSFEASAGDDAWSDKGVALVQIASGGETTTIALTHLQASYDEDNSDHSDLRAKQLGEVSSLLRDVLGDPVLNLQDWRRVIVLGDLNIRGDRWARTEEWKDVFAQLSPKAGGFGTGTVAGQAVLVDGWNTYMSLPGKDDPSRPSTPDPGYTHLNFASSPNDLSSLYRSRLDYQCYMREPTVLSRTLTPQHMMTRLKGPSDHWSLEAVAQYYTWFCNPSDAMNLFSPGARAAQRITLFPGNAVDLRKVQLKFQHSESYQWIFFEQEGTYSFIVPDDLEIAAYAAEDLTHPLRQDPPLDLTQAPGHVNAALHEMGIDGRPATFALPRMSLLRFRSTDRDFVGERVIGILRHRGESPATAIILKHDVETDPRLPAEPLSPSGDDLCWFKVVLPRLLSGAPYEARFSLFNRNSGLNRAARWALLKEDHTTEIQRVGGDDLELPIQLSTPGGTEVFLTLRRADVQHTFFTARWVALLSALYLREPLCLFCEDETGPDWLGSDEITVKLYLDGEVPPFFETEWEADSDEFLNLLNGVTNAMRLPLDNAGLPHTAVPFATGIRVEVAEDDGALGTSTANAFLTPATESEKKVKVLPMNVQSGKYVLHAVIGKWRF